MVRTTTSSKLSLSLKQNFSVGLLASVWSAILGFAMVPIYLKYLGIESYGLIGFFTTTLAILSLLDMGLAPTINREVARFTALGESHKAAKLLHTLSVVYWSMAFFIIIMIVVLAPYIAEYWLKSKQFTSQTITYVIMLMGLVAASRWPVGLYQGALMGAQRQAVSSYVNIIMSTFSSLGTFMVLALLSPTIEAFFIFQACVGIMYAIAIRWITWRIIGRLSSIKFDITELKRVWRFSAGMGAVSVISLILTQLDKVLLSNMVGLVEFGHYALATVVVSSLAILFMPVFNVIYPRFSALVATGELDKLSQAYRLVTRLLATVLFPIAMLLVSCSQELVLIWTGNAEIAKNVAPIISLLAIASALHGVIYIAYALQLAFGLARLVLTISIILLTILFPLIIIFVLKYGVLGGALALLLLHMLSLFFGTWLTHRSVLKGLWGRWLFQDVGIPLAISAVLGVASYLITKSMNNAVYLKLTIGLISALVAVSASVLLTPQFRMAVLNTLKRDKVIKPI